MKSLTLILSSLALLCCSPTFAQDCLKVMSYNIRLSTTKGDGRNAWPYRRAATARLLQTERPALIGMQELCSDQIDPKRPLFTVNCSLFTVNYSLFTC